MAEFELPMEKSLHVGIILDGNRRWAKAQGLPVTRYHERGFQLTEDLLEWCEELPIRELTLFGFSAQNFERPNLELKALYMLFKKYFERLLIDERVYRHKLRIKVVGNIAKFPQELQKLYAKLKEATAHHDGLMVNFALGYGGREDIAQACQQISAAGDSITLKAITGHLEVPEDLDILIRTGGERRISNFLLWQSSYAELFFIDKLFPDFTKIDLKQVLLDFFSRQRRFGK